VPTDDPRLEQALHDAAQSVDSVGVVARVVDRRIRRRRNRRLAAVASTLVVLMIVGTVTVLLTRDNGSSPHIATPGSQLRARVVTGGGAVGGDAGRVVAPRRVTLDADAHLLRAPLVAGATTLSVASYDPGADGAVLSHVVRIDGSHVVDIKDFKAHILSIAEGEGARWALTQNPRVAPGRKVADAFLKRIPASGDPTSVQLPLDSDPVGPVAAVGGAVWVPVRDGVLQFDTNGDYVRRLPLQDATDRWVAQVGKLAYVTDGKTLRSLDVSGSSNSTITYGPEILGLASAGFDGRVLLADESGSRKRARVARAESESPVHVTAVLPEGFAPAMLAASTKRFWAVGTVDDSLAIALLTDRGVLATVVLENATDGAALAWTGPHTVTAVSGDVLYDIEVP
jgi:hypothetical protein